jgi:hypothetical protein
MTGAATVRQGLSVGLACLASNAHPSPTETWAELYAKAGAAACLKATALKGAKIVYNMFPWGRLLCVFPTSS